MVYQFMDKKTGSELSVNEETAQELHKPVIKRFKRSKACAKFKDDIWAANIDEMGILSSFNRGVKYLLCVIDVFTKYTWFKALKDKKLKQFVMVLLKQ